MPNKTQKTILLQEKCRYNSTGKIQIVPELRISGKWLHDQGFEVGKRVMILINKGELTIKTIEE